MAVFASKWFPLLIVELLIAGAGLLYVFTIPPSCTRTSSSEGLPLELGLNYGNSTGSIWSSMRVPACGTLYDAMRFTGWRMDTKSYGSLGVFIVGINGVEQTGGAYWQWYGWAGSQWRLGSVGASSYIISGGEIILWYFGSTIPSASLTPASSR